MSKSQKFPVAVHVLVALELARREYVSSETLARSVATNPVVVRRILQTLKKAGLAVARGGVYGGTTLGRPAEEITLLDVLHAVEGKSEPHVHGESSSCWIAHGIRDVIPDILDEAEQARCTSLESHDIAELATEIMAQKKAAAAG